MLNVMLAVALVHQKLEAKNHVHLDNVTQCVRHLDLSRDPLGGFDVRAVGPDGQAVRFPDVPYRYAQVSLYRGSNDGPLYVSLDFTNAWGTDALGFVVEVRVQHANRRDRIDRKPVLLGGSANGGFIWSVIDAVRLLLVCRDVRVNPCNAVIRVLTNHR